MTIAFAPLQFLPAQIHLFETLPSTNDYLKEMLIDGQSPPEGTVVWALSQTKGRGQLNNTWLTAPSENITLNILLRPSLLHVNEIFRLSKAIALAVNDILNQFIGSQVAIKWPNDIFFKSQKVAGILIENSIQGDLVKSSIIGIGINVNQNEFLSENNPTSIYNVTGIRIDLEEVKEVLLQNVNKQYLLLQQKNYVEIDQNYFQNLFQVDKLQNFIINEEIISCVVNEVLPDGSIILTIDEEKKAYLYGEARWKI